MSLCLLKGIFSLLLSFIVRNWQNEKNGLHCSDSALKSQNLKYFYSNQFKASLGNIIAEIVRQSIPYTIDPPSKHSFLGGGGCVKVLKGVVRLWFHSQGINTNEKKNWIWLVVNLGVGSKGH